MRRAFVGTTAKGKRSFEWFGLTEERLGHSPDYLQRIRFGWVMLLYAWPSFCGYAIYFFIDGLVIAGAIMLFSVVCVTISIFLYFAPFGVQIDTKGFNAIVIIGVLIPLLLAHFNLIWMNGRLEFLVWLFLYPPLAFFLLGDRYGFILLCVFGIVGAFGLIVPPPRGIRPIDPTALVVQCGFAMFSCALIPYFSERTR